MHKAHHRVGLGFFIKLPSIPPIVPVERMNSPAVGQNVSNPRTASEFAGKPDKQRVSPVTDPAAMPNQVVIAQGVSSRWLIEEIATANPTIPPRMPPHKSEPMAP